MIGYKWLSDDMESSNGNEAPWEVGVWKEWVWELELCRSGFHACRTPLQSLRYVYGNRWFIIEAGGQYLEEKNDKFACSRMKIIKELPAKEIMIRFAVACAKNSLFRFEQKYPYDGRPRKAIEAAENCLASGAAEAAGAAWAAEAAEAAEAAGAAWAAARAAAGAAEAAEIKWQEKKLLQIVGGGWP